MNVKESALRQWEVLGFGADQFAAQRLSVEILGMIAEELVEITDGVMFHPRVGIDPYEEDANRNSPWIELLRALRIIARGAEIGRLHPAENRSRREVCLDIIGRAGANALIDKRRFAESTGPKVCRGKRSVFGEAGAGDDRAELIEFLFETGPIWRQPLDGEPMVQRLFIALFLLGPCGASCDRINGCIPRVARIDGTEKRLSGISRISELS